MRPPLVEAATESAAVELDWLETQRGDGVPFRSRLCGVVLRCLSLDRCGPAGSAGPAIICGRSCRERADPLQRIEVSAISGNIRLSGSRATAAPASTGTGRTAPHPSPYAQCQVAGRSGHDGSNSRSFEQVIHGQTTRIAPATSANLPDMSAAPRDKPDKSCRRR
jgi:hypothetical protein